MSRPRRVGVSDLNSSLHSVKSADDNVIPFVDDENDQKDRMGKSSDSISSNESFEPINYSPRRRGQLHERRGVNFKMNQNTTGTEASGESDTDDGQLAMEKRDKPGPLASEMSKLSDAPGLGVLRRNSISMPVLNENDLDALRQLHMTAVESNDNMDSSKESLSKITVSCFLRFLSALARDMFMKPRNLLRPAYHARDTIVLIIFVFSSV